MESQTPGISRRLSSWTLRGRTTVGGEPNADLQRNSKIGVTLAYPFLRQNAIKASYSAGVVTESGGDFQTILLSYQRLFR